MTPIETRPLLKGDPNKVDGRVADVAGVVLLANVDGVHPANRSVLSYNSGPGDFAAIAARPHAALYVDKNLVAGVTVDALPLTGLDLHPLNV